MRTSFVLSAFVVAVLAATHGCTLPLQGLSSESNGGAGATSVSSAGGAATTGAGVTTTATGMTTTSSGPTSSTSTGAPQCTVDGDCGTSGFCVTYTCSAMGTCVKTPINDQQKVGTNTPGDCKKTICLDGAETTLVDLGNFIEDGNGCTIDGCDPNGPVHPLAANGDDCSTNGGQHCFNGMCLQCGDSSQCSAGGKLCTISTCNGGLCGTAPASNGTGCDLKDPCKVSGKCNNGTCAANDQSDGTICINDFFIPGACASGGCCVTGACQGGSQCCKVGQHCTGAGNNGQCTY